VLRVKKQLRRENQKNGGGENKVEGELLRKNSENMKNRRSRSA